MTRSAARANNESYVRVSYAYDGLRKREGGRRRVGGGVNWRAIFSLFRQMARGRVRVCLFARRPLGVARAFTSACNHSR